MPNFTNLADHHARGAINYASDTFKVMLVSSVPSAANLDAWVNRSDVTNESAGTGYTAGGVAVTATVGALDTANNRVPVTFTDITSGWPAVTTSAVGCVIYKSTGSASTDKLVAFVDFSGTKTASGGSFAVSFTNPLYINV